MLTNIKDNGLGLYGQCVDRTEGHAHYTLRYHLSASTGELTMCLVYKVHVECGEGASTHARLNLQGVGGGVSIV